jgi:hypothetical protein
MNVEVNVKNRILKPVKDFFTAIVDPAKMSHYFISSPSGPMKSGTTIKWEFVDVGARLSVEIKEVERRPEDRFRLDCQRR